MDPSTPIDIPDSPTFFSGWRPLIGWIIAGGFIVQYIVIPLANVGLAYLGKTPVPGFDTGSLVGLTTGVLGLGGLRTYEKCTNSEGNR